ncbi:MAG: LLM class flavin-dependent oxidoreductase [Microbacteriaceae bacterium]|nr:LLM class flavin-dependent oxidoreductase [Microbacteriaceae bacterium]
MTDASDVEFGLDTFGDVTVDLEGAPISQAQTIRNVVAEGRLADEVGVDAFGLGEHHRVEFAVSSPEVVLAGIASVTERIKLGSAVTVLSSDDPVRVWQRFSELDAISGGRAEVILGRGSFIESFPLFGYSLDDYEELFEQKLALWVRLLEEAPVRWEGGLRPAIPGIEVYPKTESGHIRTWVGVGGSPQSVVRAAHHGLPLTLAIIGGDPRRFAPFIRLYRQALEEIAQQRGAEPQPLPVAVHSPGFVARTDEEAYERFVPFFMQQRAKIGAERGWPPPRPDEVRGEIEHGALHLGSPETVARKVAATVRDLGVQRFDLKYSGSMPHEYAMESIELYGREVLPMVKDLLAG